MVFFGRLIALLFFTGLFASSRHFSGEEDDLYSFTYDEAIVKDFIETEDYHLSTILKNNDQIFDILEGLIHHNLFYAFIDLFPLLGDNDFEKSMLLNKAIQDHSFEIFDFLLYQEFRFEGVVFGVWLSSNRWEVEELKVLVTRHPDRLRDFLPSPYWLDRETNVKSILDKIEFINYCRTLDQDFAQEPAYKLPLMINLALQNRILSDVEMTEMIYYLDKYGLSVDSKMIQTFIQMHPDYLASYGLLNEMLYGPEVKDPGCE